MANAESMAAPSEQPDGGGEVISLGFGRHESPQELEMEDLFLGKMLSGPSRDFILEQADVHNVHPYQILDAAVESYKYFLGILAAGGSILTVDKYGLTHPVVDNEDGQPPAA